MESWSSPGFSRALAIRLPCIYKNLYLYGGFFDVLAQLFARMSPLDLYEDRHLANIAFAILGLGGTWRLGTLVLGNRGGVLAMVLTALTPMFYGHSFNNPKDIPFAAVFVWTLCHLYEAARPVSKTSTWAIAKLAISFGALLAIRPAGMFFLAYIMLWWSLSLLRAGSTRAGMWFAPPVPLVIVLLGAWTLMLSLWPWAQVDPIINPLTGDEERRAIFVQRDDLVLRAVRACTTGPYRVLADMVRPPVAGNLRRRARCGSHRVRCSATADE